MQRECLCPSIELLVVHRSAMQEPQLNALVLVGGFWHAPEAADTVHPEPLVPFCNKPMVVSQLEALVEVRCACAGWRC